MRHYCFPPHLQTGSFGGATRSTRLRSITSSLLSFVPRQKNWKKFSPTFFPIQISRFEAEIEAEHFSFSFSVSVKKRRKTENLLHLGAVPHGRHDTSPHTWNEREEPSLTSSGAARDVEQRGRRARRRHEERGTGLLIRTTTERRGLFSCRLACVFLGRVLA